MLRRLALTGFLLAGCLFQPACPAAGEEKQSFRIAWSLYVGWMPWDYAAKSGILQKWADRSGIQIELVRVDDYVKSIEQYTQGKFDGCAMTNMDMLTIPAAEGVDSTALIVGDFSNGNDGIVMKGDGGTLAEIKGRAVSLVENSVSHYLLARGLQIAGIAEHDVKIVNTSDAAIVAAFRRPDVTSVVTWKPQLAEILAMPRTTLVFDSTRIPGEIIDLMVVNTAVLRANPQLGHALVGAWYETLGIISAQNPAAVAAQSSMAKASGTDLAGFRSQLATTKLFNRAAEAHGFMAGSSIVRTMELVREFCHAHKLLGTNAKSVDAIGMEFPHNKLLGSPRNIRIRFDASYTQQAAGRGK